MLPTSERSTMDGPAGRIELVVDRPAAAARGFAFVGHPHPLYGGTLDNKVAATLARAFVAMDWVAVRPNFRGVGASEGVHDEGRGETEDFLHLVDVVPRWPLWGAAAAADAAAAPIALAGFSFGSFVAAGAAQALARQGRPVRSLVLVGAAAGKWPLAPVDPATLVIHGEVDETIPLAEVFPWARSSDVPVIVMPGADHFFHRRLTALKQLVIRHVLGAAAAAALHTGGQGGDD